MGCHGHWGDYLRPLSRGEHREIPGILPLPLAPAELSFCIAQYVAKRSWENKNQPGQARSLKAPEFLECSSNVKIKQGLLAAVMRVATLLVQTKVWVKPSLRLKPDTIGGSAESQKAKGILCNHLLSCFLFHKLWGDQVLRSLCHFPQTLPHQGDQQRSQQLRGATRALHRKREHGLGEEEENSPIIIIYFTQRGCSYNPPVNCQASGLVCPMGLWKMHTVLRQQHHTLSKPSPKQGVIFYLHADPIPLFYTQFQQGKCFFFHLPTAQGRGIFTCGHRTGARATTPAWQHLRLPCGVKWCRRHCVKGEVFFFFFLLMSLIWLTSPFAPLCGNNVEPNLVTVVYATSPWVPLFIVHIWHCQL